VLVDRIPRHWHSANVVIADSEEIAARLDGLPAHVLLAAPAHDPAALDDYAQRLGRLIAPAS
jgi:hypothetical protein